MKKDDYSLLNKNNTLFDNVKVAIRVRPPLPREREEGIPFRSIALVSEDHKCIRLVEYLGAQLDEVERQKEWDEKPFLFQLHRFTFDFVFDMDSSQADVYSQTAQQAVLSVLEGYNSTIFAYGQTGTGKTYTMEGFTYNNNDPAKGIIQRTIEDIFYNIEQASNQNTKFIIRASYLQIYNEMISDLLKPEKKNLQIREDKKKGIYVDNLTEWAVRSPVDLYALLKRGGSFRATASTYMNDVSSRSHAVFVITVEQMTQEFINGEAHTQIKVGKLNLVDLAGSERIRITGATGLQLEESKKINKSLSCLGNVINALTESKGRYHIPYRDSKLTRLLEDSLGGNCRTTMIAMISPAHESFSESLSSLHFAQRAKKIKNRPIINEDVNNRALIRQYEIELKNLRKELEEKNQMLQSNHLVMQLQEEKEQAEMDKNNALRELEKASKNYLLEREEKRNLEKKIMMMNSQMIMGGKKIEETPQFQSALKNQLKEYELKLQEIEREKQQIQEDKMLSEESKQTLSCQIEIMNSLAEKLSEKNDLIETMQEELDEFEQIENERDALLARVTQLEAILTKNKIPLPEKINIQNTTETKRGKNKASSTLSKNYLPYEAEKEMKGTENKPIVMLTADEKINELRELLLESEKKEQIHNLVNLKLLNSIGQDKQIDVNKLLTQIESSKDLYEKIKSIQKEKEDVLIKTKQQNETITELNNEISTLNEEIEEKNKVYKYSEDENYKLIEASANIMTELESIIKKTNDPKLKSDIFKLYQYINNTLTSQKTKVKTDITNETGIKLINFTKDQDNLPSNLAKFSIGENKNEMSSASNTWSKNQVNKFLTGSNTNINNVNNNNMTYNNYNNNSYTNNSDVKDKANYSSMGNKYKNDNYINKFLNVGK